MRKTKNLVIALKGLFLICTLCLLAATQSNAQSTAPDTYANSTNQIVWENTFDINESNIFQWLKRIVTLDMIREQKPPGDKPNSTPTNTSQDKRTIFNSTLYIVTDDMSIRDAGGGN